MKFDSRPTRYQGSSLKNHNMKDAIRFADATRHSGVILEAFSQAELNGEPIAGIGHKAGCPGLNTIPCRRRLASEARQR